MKAIIEQLRTLNDIDVRLGIVKRDLERLPRELAEKQAPIKSMKAAIDRAKMDVIRMKVDADSADLEVKAGEETLKKLGEQMNILKTQKEFEAIRRQMESQRNWNKENETKELGFLEKIEAKQKDIEKQQAAIDALVSASAEDSERIEKEVAELRGTVEREGAACGILITRNEPTKPMTLEAKEAGTFKPEMFQPFDRLQIVTIQQILDGERISLPLMEEVTKKALKTKKDDQPSLLTE